MLPRYWSGDNSYRAALDAIRRSAPGTPLIALPSVSDLVNIATCTHGKRVRRRKSCFIERAVTLQGEDMKTLYEKMRDNRFKALQREAIRRYHEDAKRQKEIAEQLRKLHA